MHNHFDEEYPISSKNLLWQLTDNWAMLAFMTPVAYGQWLSAEKEQQQAVFVVL